MKTRQKVLRFRSEGLTIKQIADRLDIDTDSVKWHLYPKKRQTQIQNKAKRSQKRLDQFKAGRKCVRCGYDKCIAALHFHHLDPSQKQFGISRNYRSLNKIRVIEEINKCQLLCANCHAELTYPHLCK